MRVVTRRKYEKILKKSNHEKTYMLEKNGNEVRNHRLVRNFVDFKSDF